MTNKIFFLVCEAAVLEGHPQQIHPDKLTELRKEISNVLSNAHRWPQVRTVVKEGNQIEEVVLEFPIEQELLDANALIDQYLLL